MKHNTQYYVYVVRCSDNSLYTGITTDLNRRIKEHNGEISGKGARYTRSRRPVTIVHQSSYLNRSEACIKEARIKKLSKLDKEKFIENNKVFKS